MDGLLAPYKDQIFEYARHPRDIIDQAILVWNAMYSAVRRYRETHPDWHFVTHERLSADPLAEFKPVYDYCGLTWNASAETVIAAHTRGGNPRDVAPENYRAIKRDSQAAAEAWKRRLEENEVERILEGTREVASHFYSQEEFDAR